METGDKFTDREYLKNEQYRDDSNLRSRISLHQRYSTNPMGLYAWIFSHFDLPPAALVLDVGCGPGSLWLDNLDKIPTGWRVIMADLSSGMVARASRDLRHQSNFAFVCFDILQPPLRPSSFDAVIANHMLYHVPDVERALAATHELLKPGGVLYATTNGQTHLQELANFVRRAKGEPASPGETLFQRSAKNFTLQSGGRQLSAHFADVEVHAYPDSLEVDDAEAIIHYIQSSTLFGLPAAGLARLRKHLGDQIAIHGAISITKESGLFIARKSGNL